MTAQSHKLSLWAAIFININIMVGIGLFVNTTVLAQSLGAFGWAAYAALAILLMPLILSIAKLVELFPSGGFYTYAREPLHPFAGFLSAWCYFTAKLASATLMVHTSMQLLQQIIPLLAGLHIFAMDIVVMSIFIALNMFHMRAGKSVQIAFLCMKLIPIFFVLLSGLFLFSAKNITESTMPDLSQFIGAMPLVLFAALGFEATASLSSNLKDAQRNGPRAILISYAIVVCINIIYQFFFSGVLGSSLSHAQSFLQAFPLLIQACCNTGSLSLLLQNIFNIVIASSALGGAFGILFSNCWNLHTLALNRHVIHASFFLKENRYGIPFACILAEGIIFLIYLAGTGAQQIPLQQIAAFGSTVAYMMSVLGLLTVALRRSQETTLWIPVLGLINCLFFLGSCLNSFYTRGAQSLYLFSALICFGIYMFMITRRSSYTA